MYLSDFKNIKLDENEMIIFENGLKPIRWKKTYYFNNPEWFGI
jgi:type IV secretory pathway TraG/TraD family ATPase VirD4